jgi:channel protein (hemolysin III family)
MDRAMIYVFIAGSYFPWLTLNSFVGHSQHPYVIAVLRWAIWGLAFLGILYQQVSLKNQYSIIAT